MKGAHLSFDTLMEQVAAGREEAIRELLERYQPYLVKAVRRRLGPQLRPTFDSLDFVQDVWASFFGNRSQEPPFRRPEHLVAFLTRLAYNKVIDAARRRLQLQKHHGHCELSLDDSRWVKKEGLVSDQQTPSGPLIEQEEWDLLLQRQPPVYRRIFVLLRQGKPHAAIAEELGISTRTVVRASRKLAQELSA